VRRHPETVSISDEIKRILIPTDGSETGREAVEVALVLAAAEGAEVTFLRVLPALRSADPELDVPLRDAAALAAERGAPWKVDFVGSDFVSVVRLYAEAIAADLLVIGASDCGPAVAWHGRPIARALVRSKARPILIAPRSHAGVAGLGSVRIRSRNPGSCRAFASDEAAPSVLWP
jgi:nucleotide-binding universal stress UspA family protein